MEEESAFFDRLSDEYKSDYLRCIEFKIVGIGSERDHGGHLNDFNDARLYPALAKNLTRMFHSPTQFQRPFIPLIMSGRDVIAKFLLRCGKMTACLAAVVNEIVKSQRPTPSCHPQALILVLRQSHLMRIADILQGLVENIDVSFVVITGLTDFKKEHERIKAGCDIILATSGRLARNLQEGYVSLKKVKIFVAAETEQLIKGQEAQFQSILEQLPENCQKVMFDYEFSFVGSKKLTKWLKNDYVILKPADLYDQAIFTRYDIEEEINIKCESIGDKIRVLRNELAKRDTGVLIFIHRDILDTICQKCQPFLLKSISANTDPEEQNSVLDMYRKGLIQGIVIDKVLSKSFDYSNTKLVVNFDCSSIDIYIFYMSLLMCYEEKNSWRKEGDEKKKMLTFYVKKRNALYARDLQFIYRAKDMSVPEWILDEKTYYFAERVKKQAIEE